MQRRNFPGNVRGVILGLLIWVGFSSFQTNFEKLKPNKTPLFIINRNRDANEIWYSINSKMNGEIDNEKPILAFWVKKEKNGRIEPLSWIQKNYSYGIKVINYDSIGGDSWKFQFVSYHKRSFILKKTDHQYKVFTSSNCQEIEVTRIFVQIEGGSFWVPSVAFVQLTGVNTRTGKIVSEIIKP